ncbi:MULTISPECIES: hypothetical protein [unclassified Streptomyces]|uniref:hypothetical protein n=1 Tax=unclassified Streptomyces TaxID=2593676 RepID=UPI00131D209D|nr:hypothetical protein [Streptomyces sp. CB01635]
MLDAGWDSYPWRNAAAGHACGAIEQSDEPPVAERGVAPSSEVGDELAQLLRQVPGRSDAGLLDPAAHEGAVHRVGAHQRHIDLPESSGKQLLTLPFMGRKDPVTEQRVKTTHWWFVNLRVAEDLGNEQEALEKAVTLTCRAAEWMRNGRTG